MIDVRDRPAAARGGAAGAVGGDRRLRRAMTSRSADEVDLAPGARALVRTGFAIAIPVGFECQIRPRSGLALKHGVTLPNTPATIDSDYRGELKVALINLGAEIFRVTRGMRIAQLVFARVESVTLPAGPRCSGPRAGGRGASAAPVTDECCPGCVDWQHPLP